MVNGVGRSRSSQIALTINDGRKNKTYLAVYGVHPLACGSLFAQLHRTEVNYSCAAGSQYLKYLARASAAPTLRPARPALIGGGENRVHTRPRRSFAVLFADQDLDIAPKSKRACAQAPPLSSLALRASSRAHRHAPSDIHFRHVILLCFNATALSRLQFKFKHQTKQVSTVCF